MILNYRKTRNHVWVIHGPVHELTVGDVEVTLNSGATKQDRVFDIGQTFMVDGVPYAYGYLEESDHVVETRDRDQRKPCISGGDCAALGSGNCGGFDCDA